MKKINMKKLPLVFKINLLWGILSYYGYLHEWRWVLEKMSKETKNIWEEKKYQLMTIGRKYRREIELDRKMKVNSKFSVKEIERSWLDLLSLTLSVNFDQLRFDFSCLIDKLDEDEVVIIDSHSSLFKDYQILFWRKDKIADILPAIQCPSFKSENQNFNRSEMKIMTKYIAKELGSKSVVIERFKEGISLYSVNWDTLKITPKMLEWSQQSNIFSKLQERNKIWIFHDWVCKPKKIRVWTDKIRTLQSMIDKVKEISHWNDSQFGVESECEMFI